MDRRSFLKAGAAGTAATAGALAAPTVVRAQESFTWRMTNAYVPAAPFYSVGPGSPTDMIEKIETMSGGRLRIQHFGAGELVPAFEGFDAVVAGTVEANGANSYFWSGKSFAAQYFTTVPFGMSFLGHMAWLYHGGGIDLWHEVYEPFNCVAFPMNNTGVQMAGWFREPVESLADLDGLRMRIPGLAGRVYSEVGVTVRVLPNGKVAVATGATTQGHGTATTLSDGRLLASNGDDQNQKRVLYPEVYDPAANTWTVLTGASRQQILYAYMMLMPDGRVYEAGAKDYTAFLSLSGTGSWTRIPSTFGSAFRFRAMQICSMPVRSQSSRRSNPAIYSFSAKRVASDESHTWAPAWAAGT